MSLIHPVSPKYITDTFGTHSEQRKAMGLGPHRGLDYGVPAGTPLKAVGSGSIVRIYQSKILGHVVELRTHVILDGRKVLRIFAYCHLDYTEVKVGQKIAQGEIIAHSGNSGASSGPHLHLMVGITENLMSMPVENPLRWLPKVPGKE